MNPVHIVLGLMIAALLAIGGVQTHRLDNAQTELAQKGTQLATWQATAARDLAAATQRARDIETAKATETERIAHESDQRVAAATARARAAERTVVGLRGDIARLNSRPAPADPAAAAFAHEAGVARELLGACAAEYHAMAGEADFLRDQVVGLQDYALVIGGNR